jgi:hypothetical protein
MAWQREGATLRTMDPIADYFSAERTESLFFVLAGLGALALAGGLWRRVGTPAARAACWPLALIAALQLTVGATVFVRSPDDIVRVKQIERTQRPRLRSEEVPRLQAVMRNFALYRTLEMTLVAIGLVMTALGGAGSRWRGAGLALAAQAALMLVLDYVAERRGEQYLVYLQSL